MRLILLILVDQCSSNLLHQTWDELLVITPFTACRYLDTFQRYLRPNSKRCSKMHALLLLDRSKHWANMTSWLVVQSSSIFLFNAGETVVYNAIYHLSMALSVPKILALEVKSCSKLNQIMDISALTNFQWVVLHQNMYQHYHAYLRGSFMGLLLLAPKLQWLIRYILSQLLTLPSEKKLLEEAPSRWGMR